HTRSKRDWSSDVCSSDLLPEGGRLADGVYKNQYFGLTYALPTDWTEKYTGPPPSDTGYYVLAQIRPADKFKGKSKGSILIVAQDLFFTLAPAGNTLDLIYLHNKGLSADYRVEQPPTLVRIANHSFVRFDYGSPVAELHWRVLATQIRCRSEEHTSELQSRFDLVCRLLLEKKNFYSTLSDVFYCS